MLKIIGSILKGSLLVLVILVLSHIIQIRGVTLSQHVQNGLDFITQFSPTKQAQQIQDTYTKSVQKRIEQLNSSDPEINPEDQRKLNQVIEASRTRK